MPPAASRGRGTRETRRSGTFPVGPAANYAGGVEPSVKVADAAASREITGSPPAPSWPVKQPRQTDTQRRKNRGAAAATGGGRVRRKALLLGVCAGLAIGGMAALALVPVPVRAWGIISIAGAPQALTASVTGRVSALLVRDGDSVGEGAPVLRIHSLELQLEVDRRRRELEDLKAIVAGAEQEDDAALANSLATLRRRRGLVARRLRLKDGEYERRERMLDDVSARVISGFAPEREIFEQQVHLEAAREARLRIVDERSQIDVQIRDRRHARRMAQRARESRVAQAEARLRDAQSLLRVGTVDAPRDGWIESLLVAEGSVVQRGAEIARLVPLETPRSVVALVPAREASHARVGDTAEVRLRSVSGDGSPMAARVRHVSREVAPRPRVSALLGSASTDAFVQLELELLETREYRAVRAELRPGSQAVVTLEGPERTLGSLVRQAVERKIGPLLRG